MEPQAPEPQPQPQKKKLGPLAWVLIGCLGIVILAGGTMLVGGFFVAKKVKDVADDYKENPARAAAQMVVRVNPDLELVETDDEAQTMTIRNKQTGEVFTADWSDIKEGKFRLEADGKQVTFAAKEATTDEGGGMISVTDESGDESVVIGGGDASALPAWFPPYPGASEAGSTYTSKTATQLTGMFTFTTDDGVAEVMDYYRDELTDLGFELSENTFTSDEVEGGSLTGEGEAGRTVNVGLTRQDGVTQVGVNYTERKP